MTELTLEGWLTTDEAVALTGYARAYVRQLAIAGRVRARKVGRDWLIEEESLLAHKAQAKVGRPPKERSSDEGVQGNGQTDWAAWEG